MTKTVTTKLTSPAIFILSRSDGVKKTVQFEDEPGWILISPSQSEEEFWNTHRNKPMVHTSLPECHHRFDFNSRAKDAWNKQAWTWLKKQMAEFSQGKNVKAFYINPYVSVGGYVP